MKNKKTLATTTKTKALRGFTAGSRRKAAWETAELKQSNDGSYLFSDANFTSDALGTPSASANPATTEVSYNTLLFFLQKLDDSNKQKLYG